VLRPVFAVFSCILACLSLCRAQIPEYELNSARKNFNGGQPLPAGTEFLVHGPLPEGTTRIELEIWEQGRNDSSRFFETVWKGARYFQLSEFTIPVTAKLKNKRNYNLIFRHFGPVFEARLQIIREEMLDSVFAWFAETVRWEMEKDAFSPTPPDEKELKLEMLLEKAMRNFASVKTESFHGFEGQLGNSMMELNGLIAACRDHIGRPDFPGFVNPQEELKEWIGLHLDLMKSEVIKLAENYFAEHLVVKLDEIVVSRYPASLSWHVEH